MFVNPASAGIRQYARRVGKEDLVQPVLEVLSQLVPLCGEGSHAKQMVYRIGRTLVAQNCQPTILAPCCPDYTHEAGQYTFRGLGTGVPLLAELHLMFLSQVIEVLPQATVIIMVADQEAEDTVLAVACGVSPNEFRERIHGSIQSIRERVVGLPIRVCAMTDVMPTLTSDEQAVAEWIRQTSQFRSRIDSEACQRAKMYRRIVSGLTWKQMRERTIRTAAQYVALGRFANAQQMLICNHTTTNLSWYKETEVGVLHNPVQVY